MSIRKKKVQASEKNHDSPQKARDGTSNSNRMTALSRMLSLRIETVKLKSATNRNGNRNNETLK